MMASARSIRLWLGTALALSALAMNTPARAESFADVQRLYATGEFLEAARAGAAVDSAPALALAARALLARSMFNPLTEPDAPLLEAAQSRAEAAIALDPSSVEARLQLAAALGMRARLLSNADALRLGLAPRAQGLILDVVRRAPNDPWAQAMLGSWNLELVRRGGPFGAGLLGASMEAGQGALDRALALAPNDPSILMACAGTLLTLNPTRYGVRAETLLSRAGAATPRDAFERLVVQQAQATALVLQAHGAQAAAEALAAQIR